MVGFTHWALGIVAHSRTILLTATLHHRRVEVERVVVKAQFGEEPTVQRIEHTLVDGLRELAKVALVGTVVRPFLVTHQMAERRVEAHNVKVIVTTCATPDSCEQTVYQLL